jgi:hypothetical protein
MLAPAKVRGVSVVQQTNGIGDAAMKWLPWAVIGVVLGGIGAMVYGYGAGYFWPCEAFGDRNVCTEIRSIEGRSFQGMVVRPDGTILMTTRQHGTKPSEPVMLMTIDPANGDVVSEVEIGGLAPNASVAAMAVSADGERIALAGLDFVDVIDDAGAPIAELERGLPAYMTFAGDGRLLVYQGTQGELVPSGDTVLAFDPAQAGQPETGSAETAALFSSGLNTVIRQDGALYAQKLEAAASGVVGVRLAATAQPEAPGVLLAAQLRGGCSYHFVDMAFSPDGNRLAATADCPDRWGKESSALIVWDVETGGVVRRIPTRHWWGDMAWLDAQTLVLSRYDAEARRAGLFRVDLGE